MNETNRLRVLVPLLLPLTLLGVILVFAGSLSRILLAVESEVSVLVAVLAAGYVLLAAFVVERNQQISPRALGAGLTLGLVGLIGAGLIAASVGTREIHHEEEGHGGEGGAAIAAEGEAAIPPDALVWGSDSGLAYTDAPTSGSAGTVTMALENVGSLEHNVVFEGFQGDAAIVTAVDGVDVATVDIEAGEYTYYCSIPGHRAAGMEGQITLS